MAPQHMNLDVQTLSTLILVKCTENWLKIGCRLYIPILHIVLSNISSSQNLSRSWKQRAKDYLQKEDYMEFDVKPCQKNDGQIHNFVDKMVMNNPIN
jgi:hypothetical protein